MSVIEEVRKKVQRILTDEMGRVEIDRDGDFVLYHESAVVYISLNQMNDKPDSDVVVQSFCNMVVNVRLTPEVFKWVAIEGQQFFFGHCAVVENSDDPTTGRILFRHSIVGNDLDPNELKNLVYVTMFTSNNLDDELKTKFGGKLFSED
jgi:hypothetical protein